MNFTELAKPSELQPESVGELSGALLKAARELSPGQALTLISKKSGERFALLAWDDFETIMDRAGMRASSTADKSHE